jgi:glycine/D-amino acid oxidase-like deaminating enzyme
MSFTQSIPVSDAWDVVVAGGGPAGCAAAAAAAREGARTLLIEGTGMLGGMGTGGLVPAWCPFTDHQRIIYGGFAEQVLTTMKAGMPHVPPQVNDWVPIDPELLKRIYDDLVRTHGARVLFNTTLSAVETDDDGGVNAVIVSNKSGLSAYRARVFVDATGDADLAAWAGADFQIGSDDAGVQPSTHCFVLSNVDDYAYRTGPALHASNPNSPIYAILASGDYPDIPDYHACNSLIGPGTVGFNAGHLFDVDSTDPLSLSDALIDGRKLAATYREALAKYHPAFANAFLVATGALLGVRESRRIIGDYLLTVDDFLARRTFADEICRNSYYLDVHNKAKTGAQSARDWQAGGTRNVRYGPGESHGIPYRCLTPAKLTNVLVAGRSISCEQTVQGSVRVMPVCLAMGEAAGIAAVHAMANQDGDVHAVDTERLHRRLRDVGAYLPEDACAE